MQPNRVLARAPGKLLIAGEFAVLEGAPALVVAINRYARAKVSGVPLDGRKAPSPLHLAVAESLHVSTSEVSRLHIDTRTMFHQGNKLGLGSSSAACVAAVAALSEVSNSIDQTFELALDAHRRFQSGLGSGYDVAASTYGGALIYVQGAHPMRVNLPAGLFWKAFSWNRSASTPQAIERWRHVRNHGQLLEAAFKLPKSIQTGAVDLFDSICEFQQRLLALDHAYSLGIANAEQHLLAARAQALAAEHRVLFKQSGAGGGDVSIALSTSTEALRAFSDIAVQSGLDPLELEVDMQGVVRE